MMDSGMNTTEARRLTRGTPSGFTLIELLVVISVIALLLALLVRALRGARNQARKVMCRSNLRQFGSTLLMYVEDNEGRLPCGRAGALWLLRGSPPGEQQDPYAPEVSQSVRMARAACCPMAIKAATNTGAFHTRFTSNGNRIWEVHGTGGTTFRAWTIASPVLRFRQATVSISGRSGRFGRNWTVVFSRGHQSVVA